VTASAGATPDPLPTADTARVRISIANSTYTLEQHGANVQEVAGMDTVCLGGQSLLLPAVNLYAARDACGHGDWSRGLAVCSVSFVLRTPPCDGIRTHGCGFRESTVGAYSKGEPRPVRLMEGDLSG
jgi:hypothetical protein